MKKDQGENKKCFKPPPSLLGAPNISLSKRQTKKHLKIHDMIRISQVCHLSSKLPGMPTSFVFWKEQRERERTEIPFGKLTHSNGICQFSTGNTSSIPVHVPAMLVYRRVSELPWIGGEKKSDCETLRTGSQSLRHMSFVCVGHRSFFLENNRMR